MQLAIEVPLRVIHGLAAVALLGNLLEMHYLGPLLRPTKLDPQVWKDQAGVGHLAKKLSRRPEALQFGKHLASGPLSRDVYEAPMLTISKPELLTLPPKELLTMYPT